jgi:hypothetical protein
MKKDKRKGERERILPNLQLMAISFCVPESKEQLSVLS